MFLRPIIQNGFVVRDLEVGIRQWTDILKAGPFFVAPMKPTTGIMYRGRESRFEGRLALSYAGDLQIELIAPQNDAPSVYRDMLEARGEGFHHIKCAFDNFDEEVARFRSAGFPPAFHGDVPGVTRFAYFDTLAALGYFVEISDAAPAQAAMFTRMKEICRDWDGSVPLRDMASLRE